MTEFWSVSFYFVILKILDDIYDRAIAIVVGIVFFLLFLDIVETCFLTKKWSKSNIYVSFFSKKQKTGSRKTSITQECLVKDSCQIPCWVTFLIFSRLVYDIFSHLNGLNLAWSTLLQLGQKVGHRNSKLVYEMFQYLKQ